MERKHDRPESSCTDDNGKEANQDSGCFELYPEDDQDLIVSNKPNKPSRSSDESMQEKYDTLANLFLLSRSWCIFEAVWVYRSTIEDPEALK